MSDEAAQTYLNSSVQEFCRGSWNAYYNPDNVYEHHYNGIRKINYFLNYSNDFRNQLAHNRDTLTDSGYQVPVRCGRYRMVKGRIEGIVSIQLF